MPTRRFIQSPARAGASALALLLTLAGCDRRAGEPEQGAGTPAESARARTMVPARDRSGWNHAAGPALLVEGSSPEEAIVLYPYSGDTAAETRLDEITESRSAVHLLGRGGARFSARLDDAAERNPECPRWPLLDLRPEQNGVSWGVGFVDARITAVPLDSVDVLSPRDSLALVAEASRLASAVTAPTGPSFQGLRFTAHDLRRFEAAPGVQAIVAHLLRRVNQEANPQEEQTLLVAERDSGATSGPYTLAYAERAFGREETMSTPEVLAAVRFGGGPHASLVVARDSDAGIVYAMLERTGTRRWRLRWTSPVTHCG
jgi:hypothetical protein